MQMGFGFHDMGLGFGYGGFGILPVLVMLIFAVVIVFFVVVAVKGIGEWNRNNHSPRLTVPALVVDKRTDVSHHHGAGEHHHHHTSTFYYVTFQVDSGDRMEFHVAGREFGILVVGDQGELSFQGTRYLGFERLVGCDDRFSN